MQIDSATGAIIRPSSGGKHNKVGIARMVTTSLVVELVVIGVGATSWIVLLFAAAFGNKWLLSIQPYSTLLAIPMLASVYTLGIVSDRMIDAIFGMIWGGALRHKEFPDDASYHEARQTVLLRSTRMADMIEYSRSRMRICRGWTIHAFLIAMSLNVYCLTQIQDRELAYRVQLYGTTMFCVLGLSSWCAWRNLTKTQYLKVREQARFLNRQAPAEAKKDPDPAEGWRRFGKAG